MKLLLRIGLIVLMFMMYQGNGFGQNGIKDRPYIEVIGIAQKEITPDEIYIRISIKERYEERKKVTIEQQEQEFLARLNGMKFPSSRIKVNTARSGYVGVRIFKKDVIESKIYELKASSAEEVSLIFSVVNDAKIQSAYISMVSHSKLEDLRKELKIAAIKDAKNKAQYLLTAIGYEIDIPLEIKEKNLNGYDVNLRGSRATSSYYYIDGIKVQGDKVSQKQLEQKPKEMIEYEKLTLQSEIYIKFGIK